MQRAKKSHAVRAAFMPLLDAAPLIAAAQLDFAAKEGLEITLERETSWATLRDRVAVGHLDVAHMLAPMPIASNLRLTALPVPLIVPMALGYGGNCVTVSRALWQRLQDETAPSSLNELNDAAVSGAALLGVVSDRRKRGEARLTIGVVHTHSAHYYHIAYWLSAVGIDPLKDVDIVVVAPPLTAAALQHRQIDAFCAGEPWGSIAEREAGGKILLSNESIWRSSPEKVLGVRQAWHEMDNGRTNALVRAVYRAAVWCDDPSNTDQLAGLLASKDGLMLNRRDVMAGLSRRQGASTGPSTGFLAFARHGAAFPWLSHAAWFYSQMARWHQATFRAEDLAAACATYRPDVYRAALANMQVDLPATNSKVEGQPLPSTQDTADQQTAPGPGQFFDGRTFDPADVEGYLANIS